MDCSQYTLPGPPPTNETYKGKDWYVKPPLADVTVPELPIAIQDMSFYDDGGFQTRQFYPVSIICLGKSFCSLPTLLLSLSRFSQLFHPAFSCSFPNVCRLTTTISLMKMAFWREIG